MTFLISTPRAELAECGHSTSQRIQGVTSTELMCRACMKPKWSCRKPGLRSRPTPSVALVLRTGLGPCLITGQERPTCSVHTQFTSTCPNIFPLSLRSPALVVKNPLRPGKKTGTWAPTGTDVGAHLSAATGCAARHHYACCTSTRDFTTCCELPSCLTLDSVHLARVST